MSTKPPGGTRDFLPDDIRRREHVLAVVRRVYERYGFEPLETPAFENIETLLGKYGEDGNKLIFKILRRGEHEESGEADLALRYDLTVPLARVVAQHQHALPKFFKRYQIQPVWRADRPAKGRFREFFQCDIDSIGSASPVVEVEQLGAVCEVLTALGFEDFRVRINHRLVLDGLLQAAGLQGSGDVLVAIDKLDKLGLDGVVNDLESRGVSRAVATNALKTLETRGETPAQTLGRLAQSLDEGGGVSNLRAIVELSETTPAGERLWLDLSLARGLSYYSGAIMEITVPDLAGSLGGGGRYDHLIGMFLDREVPACGFSLGLERILVVMEQRGMFPELVAAGGVDVMVTMWNDDARGEALTLARDFRRSGLRVDVYPEADKLGKQFKYASTRQAAFVVVLGDDERATGAVTVKDMRIGSQETVPRAEAAAFIAARLDAGRP